MGLPGRPSLARVLLLSLVLSGLPLWPHAALARGAASAGAEAGAVDTRRTPPPGSATLPACSPNGDGVQDSCAWTAGAIGGWTITSFVTRGASRAARRTGAGEQTWNGEGGPPGTYRLRVLYAEPGSGRVLLSASTLVLDVQCPRIADATAAPNPFEPRPHDGDRDTTVFAMTSSEPGRLRVVISRADGGVVGCWRATPRRPAASGSAGPGGPRPGPGCAAASPTRSRPPTPPATPPARDVTPSVCCEAQFPIIA